MIHIMDERCKDYCKPSQWIGGNAVRMIIQAFVANFFYIGSNDATE
jgi:hypothetical protein